MSEVALKIIQKPGWPTDLNHPLEVIAREKSTTIGMEYVKRDEKSDIEGYDYKNILAESSRIEGGSFR